MRNSLNICLICLRANRTLKTVATELSVYHDELTDYSLQISKPQYCGDCECLLKKTYNFHQKCSKAAKILNKWMKTKKTLLQELVLQLPPITLDSWVPQNSKVLTCVSTDMEEAVQQKSATENNIDTIKEEINEYAIHHENLFKMEINCKDSQITDVSEKLIQNLGNQSEHTKTVFQKRLTNDNTIKNACTSGIINIKRNSTKESDSITNNMTKQAKNVKTNKKVTSQNRIVQPYVLLDIDDIKNNINNKNDGADSTHNLPKTTKDTPKITIDILKPTQSKLKSLNDTANNDKPKLLDDAQNSNDLPKVTTYASHKVKESEDNLELICLDDNSSNDVIVIDDAIEYPDDASLNSDDDCDDYLIPPPKRTKTNKLTLSELANIELSDEDLDDDISNKNEQEIITNRSEKKNYTIDKLLSTEKDITRDIEKMNEALDLLLANWEIPCLIDTGIKNVSIDGVKDLTLKFLQDKMACGENTSKLNSFNKAGINSKLSQLNTDLDFLHDDCVGIIDSYDNLPYPKERIKRELRKKFKDGKLKSGDGFVFDQDIIMGCLSMVTERQIKRLLKFLTGSTGLCPAAVRILKRIQNKQQETQYESVFTIQYMITTEDMIKEFEERKTYECYVTAGFKCEVCYQGFKHERQLDYHRRCSHDESISSTSCSICGVRLLTRRALKRHMSSHEAVYKCKLCPLVTYYRLSMINHYQQHKGTLYKCEPCGTTYKSRSVLMYHQSRSHPRGLHVCTTCGRAFVSALGLKTHAKRKHRGEKPAVITEGGVRCEMCDITFPSQEAHSKHERTLHGVINTNVKRRPPVFVKPRRKPNMTCRVCNALGHSYGWLMNHFNMEHPSLNISTVYADKQTYLCDVCGKGFSNKYTLREHISSHSGASYPCAHCPKRFSSRPALRRHEPTHAPPRFCCERCGNKFHSHPNLYNHMRSHIGDRRFKCSICGKGFLHRCSLKEHVRGVHNHERRVRKRGVTVTSHGVTATSHGVTDTSHEVTETAHGATQTTQDH